MKGEWRTKLKALVEKWREQANGYDLRASRLSRYSALRGELSILADEIRKKALEIENFLQDQER